jgi:hypothetical protein
LTVTNGRLHVVDEDGSIYEGLLVAGSGTSQPKPEPLISLKSAQPLRGNAGFELSKSSLETSNALWIFTVAGTHRSTGRPVTYQGAILPVDENTSGVSAQENAETKVAPGSRVYRIQGQAAVDGTNVATFDAVQQSPNTTLKP